MKLVLIAGGAIVALGLIIAGMAAFLPGTGDAQIVNIELAQPNGHTAYVDITWVVTELPEDLTNLDDLELEISSEAFKNGALTYDWAYLAQKDDRPESVEGSPPPVGAEMYLRVLIEPELEDNVYLYDNEALKLHVRVRWNGSRKASDWIDIVSLYNM